jgi:AraC family transcriptional regulator of adaptative response / DNA-3-methyladenine glycosylase II
LRLPYRAPFDAESLIESLGRRSAAGVEEVVGGAYRRSLRLAHGAGVVKLRPADGHVLAALQLDDLRDLGSAVQRCRALLDLDSDPQAVADALGSDPIVGALVRARPGRRVAGHVDGNELAVRAVLGQQVSLAGAATLAARLVSRYGEPLERPVGTVTHVFPSAPALAAADAGAERADTARQLRALPGIGPWTVSYIAMRALRDPDAFPASDLGVHHALEALGHDGRPAAAAALAERWRPYRAYAVQHLWATLSAAAPPPELELAA